MAQDPSRLREPNIPVHRDVRGFRVEGFNRSLSKVDNKDYVRVLLYSYYTTITGWGGPPKV